MNTERKTFIVGSKRWSASVQDFIALTAETNNIALAFNVFNDELTRSWTPIEIEALQDIAHGKAIIIKSQAELDKILKEMGR